MENGNNGKPTVVGLQQPPEKPIAEIEPRYRLGIMIRRFRVNAGKGLTETAEHLEMSKVVLGEVERGMATMAAGKLQELARYLNVRYDPLLEAARDWHNAVWEEQDKEGGVQLAEMTTQTASLRSHDVEAESAMELALIKAADELVFMANVAREISIRAENTAMEVRSLLERRGIFAPEDDALDGPEEVVCAGPRHHERLPVRLRRGKDFVLAFQPEDGGDPVYFCSKRCGDEWRAMRAQETVGDSETP